LDRVPGPTGEKLKELQTGRWSSAYIEGDTVRSVAMVERIEARHRAVVEVQHEIASALKKQVEGEAKGMLEQHWLADAQYQFVLAEPASAGAQSAPSPASP
jgi:hypothetical protein